MKATRDQSVKGPCSDDERNGNASMSNDAPGEARAVDGDHGSNCGLTDALSNLRPASS